MRAVEILSLLVESFYIFGFNLVALGVDTRVLCRVIPAGVGVLEPGPVFEGNTALEVRLVLFKCILDRRNMVDLHFPPISHPQLFP